MRNLKLFVNVKKIFTDLDPSLKIIGSCSKVSESDVIYALSYQKKRLYCIEIPDLKVKFETDLLCEFPGEIKIVGAVYNDVFEEVVVFFESGEVLTYKVDGGVENEAFICENVSSVKWSPNLESSVVVSGLKLCVIDSSFSVVKSIDLSSETEVSVKPINVGWGKKETQFKGSQGKKVIKEETVEIKDDDLSVNVAWRGDSLLFAVSYFENERKIKIFDKQGILQSVGENLPGLESPICWRPQGNLIAYPQKLVNRYVVGFMEKNGLKHGDFDIPNNLKVIDLDWNIASNILLLTSFSDDKYLLSFWTCGNYHWYLKNSHKLDSKPISVIWDESKENRLFVWTENGVFHVMEFIWTVDHSCYQQPDSSLVAVIDHDKILLTPFDSAIIPPPMSKWTLYCEESVNQILFSPDFKQPSDWFMCAVCINKILFFDMSNGTPTLSKILNNPINEFIVGVWDWTTKDKILCITPNMKNGSSDLLVVQIESDKCFIRETHNLEKIAKLLARRLNFGFIQLLDGENIQYDVESNKIERCSILPVDCTSVCAAEDQIFGLSESKILFRMENQIATNITSFFVRHPYVLATTSNHTLLILKSDELCEEVSLRKLERGSRIVLVTGNSVVLQLPRGNLETIQPRALTILTIGSSLDNLRYKEAVHLLRKQRISFDLCVDHDHRKFLENVDKFVDQVDQQWITLMVTEMSDDDSTKKIYSSYYKADRISLKEKVSTVSNAILAALVKQNDVKNMLARLSCLVKMKKIGEAIELANDPSSLQHLIFLVDVETLYKEALGIYNLSAALKIAEKSPMDPKEYVPYLNGLKDMEENYMKYTIDNTLKRPKSALVHISKCGEEKSDECLNLIKEFNLYSTALEIFKNDSSRYKNVAALFGEYLFKKHCFEESGLMYARACKPDKAIESFTKSGNWRHCLFLAKDANYENEGIKKLGEALYNSLVSSEQYKEAGNVALEFLNDPEKCIEAFLIGKHWQEAIFEAIKLKDTEMENVRQKVKESAATLEETLVGKLSAINKYVERLEIVRKEKANKPQLRDFDEMSDTSSVSSYRTSPSTTSRSSKMTRKMSRKLWSLKEGNPREEEALMSTLMETISNSEKASAEVKSTCTALLFFKEDILAQKLQNLMKHLLVRIESSKKIIWPKDPNEDEVAILDQKLRFPPEVQVHKGWELESLKDC